MFVEPEAIGGGRGRLLWSDALGRARAGAEMIGATASPVDGWTMHAGRAPLGDSRVVIADGSPSWSCLTTDGVDELWEWALAEVAQVHAPL
jgi:hypothetical protein